MDREKKRGWNIDRILNKNKIKELLHPLPNLYGGIQQMN